MDPYDLYMEQQMDWQNEISKRDDRISELEKEISRLTNREESLKRRIDELLEDNKAKVKEKVNG
jgi:chromosome segregation ATPase